MDRRALLTGAVAFGATAAAASGVGAVVGNAVGRTYLEENLDASLSHRGAGSLRVLWSVTTEAKVAALTFDDGPDSTLTPRVLDVLDRAGVPGTFFVLGEMARRSPGLLRRVADAGHEIANHSDDHHVVAEATPEQVVLSARRGADAVQAITGTRSHFYRPPRGDVTAAVLAAAAAVHHDVALWSVTRGGPSIADDDVEGVAAHLIGSMHPGAIVCLHDGYGNSGMAGAPTETLVTRRAAEVDALPDVLETLLADGWTFLTLSDLVARHGS